MSDDSLPRSPNSAQLLVDRLEFQRVQHARIGTWIATKWRQMLLGIMVLEIPLQLDTYLMHSADESQWGAISGFNVSVTTVCLVLLYAQWLPRVLVESTSLHVSKTLVAYLAIVGCSFFWAADRSRTVFELFLLLQAFMIFVYVANTFKTCADVLFAMKFLAIGMIIQGFFMVATRVIGNDIAVGPFAFEIFSQSHRVVGSFGSPNVASSYLALLLVPCLSLFFLPTSRTLKLLALFALVLGGCGLVLTLSRGGWVATAISAAIFGFVALRRGWLSPAASIMLIVLATLFIIGFLPILAKRLLEDDGGSAASRMPLVELSALMISENPLGVGANNWDAVASQNAELTRFREEWYYTVHNKYVLVLAEIGWIGLLAFGGFLISIVICGWRASKRLGTGLGPLALGLTAAFLGQTAHMFLDVFNSRCQVQLLFLIAALIVAVSILPDPDGDASASQEPSSLAVAP